MSLERLAGEDYRSPAAFVYAFMQAHRDSGLDREVSVRTAKFSDLLNVKYERPETGSILDITVEVQPKHSLHETGVKRKRAPLSIDHVLEALKTLDEKKDYALEMNIRAKGVRTPTKSLNTSYVKRGLVALKQENGGRTVEIPVADGLHWITASFLHEELTGQNNDAIPWTGDPAAKTPIAYLQPFINEFYTAEQEKDLKRGVIIFVKKDERYLGLDYQPESGVRLKCSGPVNGFAEVLELSGEGKREIDKLVNRFLGREPPDLPIDKFATDPLSYVRPLFEKYHAVCKMTSRKEIGDSRKYVATVTLDNPDNQSWLRFTLGRSENDGKKLLSFQYRKDALDMTRQAWAEVEENMRRDKGMRPPILDVAYRDDKSQKTVRIRKHGSQWLSAVKEKNSGFSPFASGYQHELEGLVAKFVGDQKASEETTSAFKSTLMSSLDIFLDIMRDETKSAGEFVGESGCYELQLKETQTPSGMVLTFVTDLERAVSRLDTKEKREAMINDWPKTLPKASEIPEFMLEPGLAVELKYLVFSRLNMTLRPTREGILLPEGETSTNKLTKGYRHNIHGMLNVALHDSYKKAAQPQDDPIRHMQDVARELGVDLGKSTGLVSQDDWYWSEVSGNGEKLWVAFSYAHNTDRKLPAEFEHLLKKGTRLDEITLAQFGKHAQYIEPLISLGRYEQSDTFAHLTITQPRKGVFVPDIRFGRESKDLKEQFKDCDRRDYREYVRRFFEMIAPKPQDDPLTYLHLFMKDFKHLETESGVCDESVPRTLQKVYRSGDVELAIDYSPRWTLSERDDLPKRVLRQIDIENLSTREISNICTMRGYKSTNPELRLYFAAGDGAEDHEFGLENGQHGYDGRMPWVYKGQNGTQVVRNWKPQIDGIVSRFVQAVEQSNSAQKTIDALFPGPEGDELRAKMKLGRWESVPRLNLGPTTLPTPGEKIAQDDYVIQGSALLVEQLDKLNVMSKKEAERVVGQKLAHYFIHKRGFQLSRDRASQILESIKGKSAKEVIA